MIKLVLGLTLIASMNLSANVNISEGEVDKYDLNNKTKYCVDALKKAEIAAIEACRDQGKEYLDEPYKIYSCRGIMLSAAMNIKFTKVQLKYECE